MRALLILLPALLPSCAQNTISQHEIFERSKAEIARREPWADSAFLQIEQIPGDLRITWKVSAGAFDFSDYPVYKGMRSIPGTERELRFTRDGCLIAYSNHASRCPAYYDTITTRTEVPVPPTK